MEMTLSLCMNCDNAPGCTLRNGHPVMQCEQHQVSTWQQPAQRIALDLPHSGNANGLHHFQGLCGNCELSGDCNWKTPDIITFHCEHYQ